MSVKYTKIPVVVVFLLALAIPSRAQTAPSEAGISASVTTVLTPPSVLVGGSSTAAVSLNNVPAGGFASAEFTCTYNPTIVEVSAIAATNLFGTDPVTVVNGPQNGSFIFAIAGSKGNKATTGGAAFTFSAKGLLAGQAAIDCQTRVSAGNLVLVTIPSTPANLVINTSAQGTFAGQVLAGKPVTITLSDSNGSVAGSVTANGDGTFSLLVPAGSYTAVASAPGYLRAQGSVSITSGNTSTFQTISLPAGDIDGNDVIDQFDALTIGINYNGTAPAAADLNNDGTIHVLDLEILAHNYHQSGPLVVSTVDSPTGTGTPVSISTQISPTVTNSPLPSSTQTITAPTPTMPMPTTTGGNIQPFAGAPLCPDHNVMMYHGLWNYQLGCHYDHEHGDDITALGEQYFGEWGASWKGMWMYPFESSPIENQSAPTGKHPGMKGIYRGPDFNPLPPCGTEDNNDLTGDHSPNCVIAVRGLIHILGGLNDLAARFHSGYIEVYSCKPPYRQPQDCGVFRTGGLIDYGQLQAPHYSTRRFRPTEGYTLPEFTIDFGNGIGNGVKMTYKTDAADLPSTSGEPYVFGQVYTPEDMAAYRNWLVQSPYTIDQWSSNDGDCEPKSASDPCHNSFYHFLYQVADAWHLVDPVDIRNVHFICEEGKPCNYNGSLTGLNEIMINPLPSWDNLDGTQNGFVTWRGYSDRWGNPRFDNTCASASLDCVPMSMERLPVGVAASRSDNGCECVAWEHDVYFNNVPSGWIEFPN
jgi:hypothetical protein